MSNMYTAIKAANRSTDYRRVIIREVNPAENFITVEGNDGQRFRINFDLQQTVVAIPAPGELWTINRNSNEWRLDKKMESGTEITPTTAMAAGDRRVEAPNDLYLNAQDIKVNATNVTVTGDLVKLEGDIQVNGVSLPYIFARKGAWEQLPLVADSVGQFFIRTDVAQTLLYYNNGTVWEQLTGIIFPHAGSHLPQGEDAIAWTTVNNTGPLSFRPTASSFNAGLTFFATDTLGYWRSTGSTWTLVSQGRPQITAASLSSAPFTSPYNGQEVTLVDSLTTPTYNWTFRYNASSVSTFKWEFIGGPPIIALVATSNSTNSSTYTDLANVGPGVTIPRTGVYTIVFGFTATNPGNSGGGNAQAACFSFDPTVNNVFGVGALADVTNISGATYSVSVSNVPITLNAGYEVRLRFAVSNALAVLFQNRWMHVIPNRIS